MHAFVFWYFHFHMHYRFASCLLTTHYFLAVSMFRCPLFDMVFDFLVAKCAKPCTLMDFIMLLFFLFRRCLVSLVFRIFSVAFPGAEAPCLFSRVVMVQAQIIEKSVTYVFTYRIPRFTLCLFVGDASVDSAFRTVGRSFADFLIRYPICSNAILRWTTLRHLGSK